MGLVIYKDKWCVYFHIVDGQVVYVGCGRPWRPLDFRTHHGSNRSMLWHEVTKNGFTVEIHSWYDTPEDARKKEKQLIIEFKPSCNKKHNDRSYLIVPKPNLIGNQHLLGHKHSEETRAKMRAAWSRRREKGIKLTRIRLRRLDTGEIFTSLRSAALSVNRSESLMSTAVKNGWKVNGITFERLA